MKEKQSSDNRNKDYSSEPRNETSTVNDDKKKSSYKPMNEEREDRNQDRDRENQKEQQNDRREQDPPADEDQDRPMNEEVDNPTKRLPGRELPDETQFPSRKPTIKD